MSLSSELDSSAASGLGEVGQFALHIESKLLAIFGRFEPSNALVHRRVL
jgi:hypothetical protein